MSGRVSHLAGLVAEQAVARRYLAAGGTIAATRWRGRAGEIDLIAREGGVVVFVEVKQAPTHEAAAGRLGPRQVARLFGAAAEFLDGEPAGGLTDCRFDVALVDGAGRIEILQGALAA
jgi:putative endonuclease